MRRSAVARAGFADGSFIHLCLLWVRTQASAIIRQDRQTRERRVIITAEEFPQRFGGVWNAATMRDRLCQWRGRGYA